MQPIKPLAMRLAVTMLLIGGMGSAAPALAQSSGGFSSLFGGSETTLPMMPPVGGPIIRVRKPRRAHVAQPLNNGDEEMFDPNI